MEELEKKFASRLAKVVVRPAGGLDNRVVREGVRDKVVGRTAGCSALILPVSSIIDGEHLFLSGYSDQYTQETSRCWIPLNGHHHYTVV